MDFDRLFLLPLAVADSLVRLKRGDDEAILMPGDRGGPLHLRRGARHVEELLGAAAAAETLGALLDSRPEDGELIRLLLEQGILRPASAPGPCACGSCSKAQHGAVTSPVRHSAASLYLLLSQRCNCSCVYCLAGERTYGTQPQQMSDEVARAAIERTLAELTPDGRLEVVFFGGEPLLNWPLATRLLDWMERDLLPRYPGRQIHPHLTSNLTLFPDDLIERARRHGMSFLVDVDGPPEIHDAQRPLLGGGPTHATIAANLRRLFDAGLQVSLRATITSRSVDRMAEIVLHHRDLGSSSSALAPLNPVDSDEQILPEESYPDPARFARGLREALATGVFSPESLYPFSTFLPRVRQAERQPIACGAPYGNTPVVDSAGAIWPCIYWVGIDRLSMGNVLDPDRSAKQRVSAGLMETLHVDRLERCRACDLRYLCGGGCPVHHVLLAQHPHATPKSLEYANEISCAIARTVLDELLWREADSRREGS